MARNLAAQTAFGTMVLTAVEQNEPAGRRLVDDGLAYLFLPTALRWLVAATRWAPMRRLMIRGSEFTGPGLWVNLACRKHFIDDKLKESLDGVDAVVILGAGMDTRAYRLNWQRRIPVFEVDLPVNIARKAETVRRVLGTLPLSVRLVAVDFEADDLLTACLLYTSDVYKRQDKRPARLVETGGATPRHADDVRAKHRPMRDVQVLCRLGDRHCEFADVQQRQMAARPAHRGQLPERRDRQNHKT